jgi:hypothetical protein
VQIAVMTVDSNNTILKDATTPIRGMSGSASRSRKTV